MQHTCLVGERQRGDNLRQRIAGGNGIQTTACVAPAQRALQFKNFVSDFGAFSAAGVRVGLNQAFAHCDRGQILGRTRAFAQPGLDQVMAPVAGQEFGDAVGQRTLAQARTQQLIDGAAGMLQPFASGHGVSRTLFSDLAHFLLLIEMVAELAGDRLEYGIVVAVIHDHPLHRQFGMGQGLLILRRIARIAIAGFAQRFQQLAAGVATLIEQAVVAQRQLEIRRDQPAVQRAGTRQRSMTAR